MDAIRENVSYLQGLVEGLEIDTASKEGKVISGVVDALGDIADAIELIDFKQAELENYVDTVDEQLLEVEENVFGSEFNDDSVEVVCPQCSETVYFDAGILDSEDNVEITCPTCESVVFVNDQEYANETMEPSETREVESKIPDA